jgi:hypothetical protein
MFSSVAPKSRAVKLLWDRQDDVQKLAEALVKERVLTGRQIVKLLTK